jgi:hypothetical protein
MTDYFAKYKKYKRKYISALPTYHIIGFPTCPFFKNSCELLKINKKRYKYDFKIKQYERDVYSQKLANIVNKFNKKYNKNINHSTCPFIWLTVGKKLYIIGGNSDLIEHFENKKSS